MIPIKYIGKRETYREGTYGSGIVFTKGQTINIEDDDLARKLLRHPDQYERGDTKQAVETTASKAKDTTSKEDDDPLQETRDAIATMNKGAIKDFVKTRFNVDVDMTNKVGELRMQAIGLLDQYGLE